MFELLERPHSVATELTMKFAFLFTAAWFLLVSITLGIAFEYGLYSVTADIRGNANYANWPKLGLMLGGGIAFLSSPICFLCVWVVCFVGSRVDPSVEQRSDAHESHR
jgi:hypothetical protein